MLEAEQEVIIMGKEARVFYDECMGYAVFVKVNNGTIFWQQISKWYQYKKYATKIMNEHNRRLRC